jgi:hypothetical protein
VTGRAAAIRDPSRDGDGPLTAARQAGEAVKPAKHAGIPKRRTVPLPRPGMSPARAPSPGSRGRDSEGALPLKDRTASPSRWAAPRPRPFAASFVWWLPIVR